ncbi:transporter [Yonghaparkia sp. Root332]|uniref:transporter n=1 Tax=Yonghaparkia sp. Root332 TaxID=1736516 RepID=UPI000700423F|nr:transporter [Yonghaparkia sp. Root332]KQV24932.1 transporter [Yonghaparkia sp. Root332]
MPETPPAFPQWPGQHLGLPESGPRSIARYGRRLAAVAIDWALAVLLAVAFFQYDALVLQGLFVLLQIVPLVLLNASVGHLLLGMRLQRIEGGGLGAWRPIVRSVLLGLVIPALIVDNDQRGLHDRAVRTILLRR